jgi:ketosteroid isomerase-like protein
VAGPSARIPWAGTRRGRDQVARFFTILAESVELQALERHAVVTQGDTVVVLGREQSRVKPTDRTCTSEWAMVFTLRDGRIARFREYHDTDAWAAAYAPVGAEPGGLPR